MSQEMTETDRLAEAEAEPGGFAALGLSAAALQGVAAAPLFLLAPDEQPKKE